MARFSVFRWIAGITIAGIGLAACSSGTTLDETAETSVIAPIDEPVASTASPATSTTVPTSSTTSAPTTTTTPPTTAAQTTTTEDPYDGRFDETQVAAIEGYIAAEIAWREVLVQTEPRDLGPVERTGGPALIQSRREILLDLESQGLTVSAPRGSSLQIEVYSADVRSEIEVGLILCVVDDLVLTDVDGEIRFGSTPIARGWSVVMDFDGAIWRLTGQGPLDTREGEPCPEP